MCARLGVTATARVLVGRQATKVRNMSEVKSIKEVNKESLSGIVKAHLKSDDVEIVDVDLRQKFEIGKHGQSGFCSEMKGATVKYRYMLSHIYMY